jgi:hypothetical protein
MKNWFYCTCLGCYDITEDEARKRIEMLEKDGVPTFFPGKLFVPICPKGNCDPELIKRSDRLRSKQ